MGTSVMWNVQIGEIVIIKLEYVHASKVLLGTIVPSSMRWLLEVNMSWQADHFEVFIGKRVQ